MNIKKSFLIIISSLTFFNSLISMEKKLPTEQEYLTARSNIDMNKQLNKKQDVKDALVVINFLNLYPEKVNDTLKAELDYLKNILRENQSNESIEVYFKKLLNLIKIANQLGSPCSYYTNVNNITTKLKNKVLEFAPNEIGRLIRLRKHIKKNNLKKTKKIAKKPKPTFLILEGPNGTGKTVLGKAIAKELGIEYHCFDCPDVETKFQNSKSERMTAKTNIIINKAKPCVIVFDEADAFMGRKTDYDNLEESSINKSLAILFNKIKSKKLDFIVIFTTNHRHRLPKTIRDRCKKEIEVSLPEKTVRQEIIEYYVKEAESEDKFDIGSYDYENLSYGKIGENTWGYSFRQLENLVDAVEEDCVDDILKEEKKEDNSKTNKKEKISFFAKFLSTIQIWKKSPNKKNDKKNEEKKITFTNKRFAKFYDSIRNKNNNAKYYSILEKINKVDKNLGISRSFVNGLIGGFSNGISNVVVSELHERYIRIPKLVKKRELYKKTKRWNCTKKDLKEYYNYYHHIK